VRVSTGNARMNLGDLIGQCCRLARHLDVVSGEIVRSGRHAIHGCRDVVSRIA
jgi:hypothetical protein